MSPTIEQIDQTFGATHPGVYDEEKQVRKSLRRNFDGCKLRSSKSYSIKFIQAARCRSVPMTKLTSVNLNNSTLV